MKKKRLQLPRSKIAHQYVYIFFGYKNYSATIVQLYCDNRKIRAHFNGYGC